MEFPEVDENGLESTLKVVSMTVQEERLGKDRLSLKKHFKKKFKLGRKVDRPRDTPYAAIALGGNLHANFGTGALRGQKGETPSRSGVPVSVSPMEYPANLSDSDSELNAARFTKRSRDGGGFDTPGGTGFGDSNHTKEKELQRQSSAVSSRSSATPPVLPWDQVDWGYKGSGWIQVVHNPFFLNFILFAILWSSIMLAMESPEYPAVGSEAEKAFFAIDITFTVVFTIEMAIQWMALGVFGYFGQAANKLDFVIVFTAWLSLILELSGVDAGTLTALRSLRLLRILRPLRAIRRLPALRMVVDCTVNALPAIKWIMVLGGFLAMILGLFGMQFFGGKLWSCQVRRFPTQIPPPRFLPGMEYTRKVRTPLRLPTL
jgi:hypothetical protein